MYSLGIILLELFCPFKTDMERMINVKDVKQTGMFPKSMRKWKKQVFKFHPRFIKLNPH